MSQIGKMVTEIVAGNPFPGIVIGPSAFSEVTLASGRTIQVERADCVSLRTTNPENGPVTEYLAFSNENLNPRFTPPRVDMVAGLDYDAETGEIYSLQQILDRATKAVIAFQAERAAAAQPASRVLVAAKGSAKD